MEEFGSFKDLYDVSIKAIYQFNIGERIILPGEIIAHFDKIQLAGLQTTNKMMTARGGFHNAARVFWETTEEVKLNFSQGVFTQSQYALLTNSNLIESENNEKILVNEYETLESDADGIVTLKYTPKSNLFVYNAATGSKITTYTLDENKLIIGTAYLDVIVTYDFEYVSGFKEIQIGKQLTNGYLALEGKTKIKNDDDGGITTGIIRIPKLKLIGGLSMRLGAQATSPIIANFNAIGAPVGSKGKEYVTEFFFLNTDIDSDI